jgi:ABC-type multidrug transport system ATPase subunit/pSer/pThr/pTyr-binding forkhead associated (FHA) protein
MSIQDSNAEDQVRLRRSRGATGRIEINFDGSETPDDEGVATQAPVPSSRAPSPRPRTEAAEFDVVLKSAALLVDGSRVPIPTAGLTLGSGPRAALRFVGDEVADDEAIVEATASGHVIVVQARPSATFVNGERLVAGERRPLRRGDTIALGGRLLHYLPSGPEQARLAPVALVDAGRLRTSKQEFSIGRDARCDLVLDHPTVSRVHATVRVDHGTPTIEDRGSAIGTRVNALLVKRAPLTVGDQIAIGPYRIVFDGEDLFERDAALGLAVVAVGVRVDIGDTTILQSTALQISAGELVAIIGESGAGKSTLLRALAGVSAPTSGRVLIGGEDVDARLCELGYVPQFDTVHDQLTVREALDFAARLRLPPDTADEERVARVDQVVDQLGLSDRADLRVARLSGGQRKRAAVGVELLHRPGALFLDEPTTGLDPGLERHMTQLFRGLADSGQTVALVTHATGSMALYDRVIVMARGGRLCFDGSPEDLLRAFSVEHFDDVYAALADDRGPSTVASAGDAGERALPPLPPVNHAHRQTRQIQQTIGYQTRVLASRYATIMLRDRKHLRSALIQVPILGVLTALLFGAGVFEQIPVPHFAAKSAQLIFLMVTIAVWLGSINAAREIVKERSILNRELSIGVQIQAYLASKLIILLAFATAQTLLFSFIVLALRPLHETSAAALQLVIVLTLAAWIAVLLGLVVSAHSGSEDQATGVIPLLLVPQLLFSGAIVPIGDMTTPVRLLAALVPARWSFASAGEAIHMQSRIDADPIFSSVSRYGHHFFNVSLVEVIFISGLFACGLFAVLIRLLRRPPVA